MDQAGRGKRYKFDPKLLPYCHKQCEDKARRVLALRQFAIIDNCNATQEHMEKYTNLVDAKNVLVINFRVGDEETASYIGKRSKHDVPNKNVLNTFRKFYQPIDGYYHTVHINASSQDTLIVPRQLSES